MGYCIIKYCKRYKKQCDGGIICNNFFKTDNECVFLVHTIWYLDDDKKEDVDENINTVSNPV